MNSVIIVAPRGYHTVLIDRLARGWPVSETALGGAVIEQDGSRVYLSRDDELVRELESEELARYETAVRDPVYFTVDFSDIGLCRRVLLAIADDPQLLVDNDHGVILSGSDFASYLRRQPGLDWRTSRLP